MFAQDRDNPIDGGNGQPPNGDFSASFDGNRPYHFIDATLIDHDPQASRLHESLLWSIARRFTQRRQQLIFTDDVEKMCELLASHFLHADPVRPKPGGLFHQLSLSLNMPNDELGSGQTHPERGKKKLFDSVVRFTAGEPDFDAFLARVYDELDIPNKEYLSDPGPFGMLMDRSYSPVFLQEIGLDPNRVLFIAKAKWPADAEQRTILQEDFSRSLYRLEDLHWDHSDVHHKIPLILWVLPYQDLCERNMQSIVGEKHYRLFCPFSSWIPWADDVVAEAEKQHGLLRHWNRLNLVSALGNVAARFHQKVDKDKFSVEMLMHYYGLPEKEVRFLLETNLEYRYHDPDCCWYLPKEKV